MYVRICEIGILVSNVCSVGQSASSQTDELPILL